MNLIITIDGKEVVIPPDEVYRVRSEINEYISKRVDTKKVGAKKGVHQVVYLDYEE